VLSFAGNGEAAAALERLLQPGDHALIKGSRGMEMEQIVAALRRQPEEE
jgi:UDP-N-acetylmuramoyl-tripeptide--D-alanyl-D-alanine ligase